MSDNMPRRCLAEFLGTFAIVFFGCGSVASMQGREALAKHIGVNAVFGGGVAAMIYALGGISAAHFNPAVTIGFAVVRRFPARCIPHYLAAQFGGAICASLMHCLLFSDLAAPVHYGATIPSLALANAAIVEVVLTYFLMLVIISVATDRRVNGAIPALAIGITVFLCGVFGGSLSGCSMNPARSLAPALFAGSSALSVVGIYLVAPVIGAMAAARTFEWLRTGAEFAQNAPADLIA